MVSSTAVAMEPVIVSGNEARDWTVASGTEWLETNGAGGFAMGTVAGANTRRYHGLLVASLNPPVERMVLWSRVEEELLCAGESCNLGAAQYPGSVSPTGFHQLEEFRLDPFPTWEFATGCACVRKTVFLPQGRQTAVLQYRVSARCRLRVRPFLAFRDYHSLQHANDGFRTVIEQDTHTVTARPYEWKPALRLHHNGTGFVPAGHWYFKNEYRIEMERGLDFQEDLYSPGWIDFELEAGDTAFVVGTIEDMPAPSLEQVRTWEKAERDRREAIDDDGRSDFRTRLELAAEQFVVRRKDGSPTIIAGYPWFTDWGRDTMISIPGLLIARGKAAEAGQMLSGFLNHLDQGLIPNRFPDAGEKPEYNTADATLWMFPAAWALHQSQCQEAFLHDTFYPAGKEILAWHQKGTHYNIQVDPADGLLSAGSEGTQLTWMDAKAGDWVVTPRHGKPVEINALWYNALRMMSWWAGRYGETDYAAALATQADRVVQSFEAAFWNPARKCLYDRIAPEGPDDRLRPNQIFAVSLPFPLLNEEQQRSIVLAVAEKLLTPYGLRTLEPGHPDYRGRYEGGPYERDGAYHQGTVWPWLMGPYITARLQAFGYSRDAVDHCRGLIEGFAQEIRSGCLGQLAEIYDGDPPHRPTGAAAQAWSVAELIRVMALLPS